MFYFTLYKFLWRILGKYEELYHYVHNIMVGDGNDYENLQT